MTELTQQQTVAEENPSIISNTTAVAPATEVEEKDYNIVTKIQEFFEKENFKKNYSQISAYIQDTTTNSIQIQYLQKEFKTFNHGIDNAAFIEVLKSAELKDKIIYNEASGLVGPSWKKLRNIIYITNIKHEPTDKEEIEKNIAAAIGNSSIVYKIEISESIKLTVQTPNKEEEDAKFIFGKLFLKPFALHGASFALNCAIEEEQFATAGTAKNTQQHPSAFNNTFSHQYKPTNNNNNNNNNQLTNFQPQFLPQGFMTPQQLQQLTPQQQQQFFQAQAQQFLPFFMPQNEFQNHKKQFRNNKNFNHPQTHNRPAQFNPKTAGNTLHQPATNGTVNNNNSSRSQRNNGNNSGYKNNTNNRQNKAASTGFNNGNGKRSNKVFNQNDNDFPNLQ